MEDQGKCKDRVGASYKSRFAEIKALWNLYREDSEKYHDDYGRWDEYGLCFDYVPRGTFTDQKRGFFRFQISTGGPGEEIRFYADETLALTRVEFWYLDWFDGAHVKVTGKNRELIDEIWEDWKEMELPQTQMEKATAED